MINDPGNAQPPAAGWLFPIDDDDYDAPDDEQSQEEEEEEE